MGFYTSKRQFVCPVDTALGMLSGKWKPRILWKLYNQPTMRYSDFKRGITDITEKMLIQQLRELEHDQIIKRTIYPVMPPKVEYSFTEFGQTLCPVIEALATWGKTNEQQIRTILDAQEEREELQGRAVRFS